MPIIVTGAKIYSGGSHAHIKSTEIIGKTALKFVKNCHLKGTKIVIRIA